ncbi:chemotaxis protein CheA [Halovivax limisalsi]|uniref:chemotaxis protein CheA n=1 Tax=Halovivax limisalsi TaxID=1453760 RepID=UPI001FFCDC2C|nr:chemotaxis protein CheA [Halovivax limisalsi]
MDEYVREFVEEADEAITELNTLLLELERSPSDEAVLEEIFRTAHTLKGNAGAIGLDRVSDLAHAFEDLLDAIRAGTVEVTPSLMDTIFETVDALEAMIEEVARTGAIETDPEPMVRRLRDPLAAGTRTLEEPTDEAVDAILARFDPPTHPDHEAYLARMRIAESDRLNNGLVVVEALIDAFDLIGTDPSRTAIENDGYGDRIDAVFATAVGTSAIRAALEPVDAVESFTITRVTDRFEAAGTGSTVEDDLAAIDLSSDEANALSVDELLDEFSELDDIDALAETIDDASEFDDIDDAGSFDDLFDSESTDAAADTEPASSTESTSETEDVEDANAVFSELQDEVEMVGFDELQAELEELEFDEFDEEEIGMDELLGDDVDPDDPTFLDIESDEEAAGADDSGEDVAATSWETAAETDEATIGANADPSVDAGDGSAADDAADVTVETDAEAATAHDSEAATVVDDAADADGESATPDESEVDWEPDPAADWEPDSEPESASADDASRPATAGESTRADSSETEPTRADAPAEGQPDWIAEIGPDAAAADDAPSSSVDQAGAADRSSTDPDAAATGSAVDEPESPAGEADPDEFADALFGGPPSDADETEDDGSADDEPADRGVEPTAPGESEREESAEAPAAEGVTDEAATVSSERPDESPEGAESPDESPEGAESPIEESDSVDSAAAESDPAPTESAGVDGHESAVDEPDEPEPTADADPDGGGFEAAAGADSDADDVFDPTDIPDPSSIGADVDVDADAADDVEPDSADDVAAPADAFDPSADLGDVSFDPDADAAGSATGEPDAGVDDWGEEPSPWDADADDAAAFSAVGTGAESAEFDDEFGVDESGADAFVEFDEDDASFADPADDADASADGDDPEDPVLAKLDAMEIPDITIPERAEVDAESAVEDGAQSVRVDRESIDSLLQLVEGLVTSRVRLRSAVDDRAPYEELDRELDDLEEITTELQETVMDVRLVPLETVTNRLPRLVRDLAREQEKQIDLERENDGVELDRRLLDEIGDPLIHLVRNAVDHGIEPPEEREDAGKPPEGTITIDADRVRDRVTITVADDGRGLDADRIREEAVEAGVVTETEAAELEESAVYDLVFHPGLSTASEVTDVSGRGVGMDVVRRTMETLNGSVSIESEPGEGTTVTMTLPVSVAIDDVLFVESGGEQFGLPVDVVRDVADGRFVTETDEGRVFDDGDDPLPVIELDDALDAPGPGDDRDGMVVRVRDDVRSVALHCETVHGRREVVVNPFEGFMRDVPGVGGATVRGRGEVVTILDVATL